MDASDHQTLRKLLDDYLERYSSRDDRLTADFSQDFSGFTGGGHVLVKSREEWVAITRQDFAQVQEPICIDLKDVAIQSLAETVAVVTAFFHIQLPFKEDVLSRETARLVLVFHKESEAWKISHSSISIPYHLVREGEVYPLQELEERNRLLEQQIDERTAQLTGANAHLRQASEQLAKENAERRRVEAALAESEALYRSILAASPDDITITDLSGRILMVSPMALSLFGFAREEQGLGRPITDFIVPEDRERALARVGLMLRGDLQGPSEYRALRLDGSVFDIEVNSGVIKSPQGQPTKIVLVVRDISERKQAEAALRESEEKYRTLVERANEAIIILQDGVFVFANRKMSELFDVPLAQLQGQPFIDFVWPEDRETVGANYRRRVAGEPVRNEYDFRIVGGGGRETWVFLSAATIQWKGRTATLNLVTDITDRKRAEEALQKAFDQIKTLRGLLPICMHCKKIRDGQGRWNPVEIYVRDRTEAQFSHGLCPECLESNYPEDEDRGGGTKP